MLAKANLCDRVRGTTIIIVDFYDQDAALEIQIWIDRVGALKINGFSSLEADGGKTPQI